MLLSLHSIINNLYVIIYDAEFSREWKKLLKA